MLLDSEYTNSELGAPTDACPLCGLVDDTRHKTAGQPVVVEMSEEMRSC